MLGCVVGAEGSTLSRTVRNPEEYLPSGTAFAVCKLTGDRFYPFLFL